MAGLDRIQKWFSELEKDAETIQATKRETIETKKPSEHPFIRRSSSTRPSTREYTVQHIDGVAFIKWQTSVLSLLNSVFGSDHPTFVRFETASKSKSSVHGQFDAQLAIFQSAKTDFECGYLFDIKNLAHQEVFVDELDQAEHFLGKGFKVPAAVIAGTVLESTLRRMCDSHSTLKPSDNINAMNTDLYTAGVDGYGKAVHKQVGAWADIRNDAAHGRPDEFDHKQVNGMIAGLQDFVAKHMI